MLESFINLLFSLVLVAISGVVVFMIAYITLSATEWLVKRQERREQDGRDD